MSPPLPELASLVRTLIRAKQAGETLEAQTEALERVLQRLSERITPLVGGGGFHLLLGRALRRAQAEHAWLEPVRVEHDGARHLSGFMEAAPAAEPEQVHAAAERVVAELIGLLARFMGADIAIRLVRQSFPDVDLSSEVSGVEQNDDE